jgi:hypothetical protein
MSAAPRAIVVTAVALTLVGIGPLAAALRMEGRADRSRIAELYGKLPLSFEANEGQLDRAVQYLARGPGYGLYLTGSAVALSLRGSGERSGAVVRMELLGARRDPRPEGLDRQVTESNYFLGNDPRCWHTRVPSYGRVRFAEVYPGVDLVYHGSPGKLEYDFVVAPGADPRRIRLGFRGAESVTLGGKGELVVHTAAGDLVEAPPVVYQEDGNGRQLVPGTYVIRGSTGGGHGDFREVSFKLGNYDRRRPLILDPVLAYSTYLGGSAFDEGHGIAVDSAGNAYVTGATFSTNFPTVNPIQPANGGSTDAFVTKINAAGTALVYSTYLGGTFDDGGSGIAVDSAGNAYVTGRTLSTNFPTVNPIQPANGGGPDAFVTKINAAGTALVYSTYLGGTFDDGGSGIAVDSAGNAYVTGFTLSTNFPTVNPIQPANGGSEDAFVTKINAAGTALVYSTYLGGSGTDDGFGIAVDSAGNAYVTGFTFSTNFPTVNPIQPANGGSEDAFVTKINAAGTALVYSTYLGGSGDDDGLGIAADSAGNAYVTGPTFSTNFPTVNPIQPANGGGADAFVTKINAAGTALVDSTYLGGTVRDEGLGIAVDSAGNAYVTGITDSTNFPTVNPIQPANGGGPDAFVAKIGNAPIAIAAIPALSVLGLILLASGLAAVGCWSLWRA